jgi:hypothetical protein
MPPLFLLFSLFFVVALALLDLDRSLVAASPELEGRSGRVATTLRFVHLDGLI